MSVTESAEVAGVDKEPFRPQALPRSHTGWRVYGVAGCVGALVFGAGFMLDWWLLPGRRPVFYSDGFTALVATLLAFLALRHYDKRRREMAARLAIIADVNHHVRNAITAVMLRVHVVNDPELLDITNSAVKRIDWVLREVLPRKLR